MQQSLWIDVRSPINWGNSLMTGLVSRWKNLPGGQWGRGTKWRDLVLKSGKDGTLTNGPAWEGNYGRPGGYGSIKFDGSDDYVSISGFSLSGELTISGWARATTLGTNMALIAEDVTNFAVRKESGDKIQWLSNGYGVSAVGATSVTANTWFHWAGRRAGSSGSWTIHVFLNGKSDGTTTTASDSTIQLKYIGELFAATQVWTGQQDDVMVHSRALSDNEILNLYLATRRPDDPTLNWLQPWSVNAPAAAGGGDTPSRYRFLPLLGAA